MNVPVKMFYISDHERTMARLLAMLMGISNQHAVGSLIEFWNFCDGLYSGCDDVDQNLSRDEITILLRCSFGQDVDPDEMVMFGLLRYGDGDDSFMVWRVNT